MFHLYPYCWAHSHDARRRLIWLMTPKSSLFWSLSRSPNGVKGVSRQRQKLGQLNCWHSRCLAMPRSILHTTPEYYLDVIFDTVVIMHQPTNGKPAPIFLFGSIDVTETTIRKNTKATHNLSEKRREKRSGFSISLHMRFKYDAKISDRNSQNWAGHRTINNATCSHHYLFNV